MNPLNQLRQKIRQQTLADETRLLDQLVDQAGLSKESRQIIANKGARLVHDVRENSDPTLMENFLGEFGLSTKEGVALMCLAEALLRIPDSQTIDALIADKISSSNWDAHLGKASSSLVNASTWALMLTGRVLSDEDDRGLGATLQNLVRRAGEPVIRAAVAQAMKELGRQFVLGETIETALARGKAMRELGYTYSFDMLGEAAINQDDAQRYHLAYGDAITEIAKNATADIRDNAGISVKLSALHPRYETIHKPQMFDVLVSRTKSLAMLAMGAKIGFNIDAEEAARLDISLDVIEAIIADPVFAGWGGLGIVVQAYSKRALAVVNWLYQLAKIHDQKIMVRLVKGAYWDSEIKQAQVLGLGGYSVFTRKENTDISYITCARKLLSMRDFIYPQFATHNAHTVAAVLHMAGSEHHSYEFQRLHGMGEALMDEIMSDDKNRCRIYAPVGAHKDLLAYLVRRLLENGANSSFVHQIVDETVSPEKIAADPFEGLGRPAHNANIVLPKELFGGNRINSRGFDINDPVDLVAIEKARQSFRRHIWLAKPLLATKGDPAISQPEQPVFNPANHRDQVGGLITTNVDDINGAISAARAAQPGWAKLAAGERAAILNRAADLYEQNTGEIFALLAREAGKTIGDCVGELREAVDFLRFYANEAIRLESEGTARGIFTCISPWNFPLAIFTGQIAAALGAGNAVLAKPAEQTPLIACRASELLHRAGVPEDILQLLPGEGAVIGGALTASSRIDGICFTGSTSTAQTINRTMARHMAPDAPLIAETGGLNVMIVDSTALPQQAIGDVLSSAFQSAGQRCSACRLLYLQNDIAEEFMVMLRGAMASLRTGDPWKFTTDIGPLIDQSAHEDISTYVGDAAQKPTDNFLLAPSIKYISGIEDMQREIFGPVLHVATFEAGSLDKVVDQINAKGYGLTFGLHTRIDSRVEQVTEKIHCGNIYINRNQIGAIVGSQPFGGEGLSGTGPKAGGTNYLRRFMRKGSGIDEDQDHDLPNGNDKNIVGEAIAAAEIQDAINQMSQPGHLRGDKLRTIMSINGPNPLPQWVTSTHELPGPTGESNILAYAPKGVALCLGPSDAQATHQALAALAADCSVVIICRDPEKQLRLLQGENAPIQCLAGRLNPADISRLSNLDVVAMQPGHQLKDIRLALATRDGAIISVVTEPDLPTAFLHERHTCIDTTAAGGNAALMVAAG